MPWFYYVARVIVRGLLKLLTRCQVRGTENIPGQGGLLIIANHLSLADPPLLGVSFSRSRKMMFMAKKELFRFRAIAYFIGSLGAFRVDRKKMNRQALRQALRILSDGMALVMFPEGTRSLSGELRSAFSGPALIAVHSGAPILPVGIIGTEKIRGITWLLRRPRIMVNIGRPFYLPAVDGKLTKEKLAELTDFMMRHIAERLPREYRGEYGDKEIR